MTTTTTTKTTHVARTVATLTAARLKITDRAMLPSGHGLKMTLANGAVVTVYRTGTVLVQGKNAGAVKAVLAAAEGASKEPRPASVPAASVAVAAVDPAPAPATTLPPGWTTEPWDGETLPWE